MIKRILFVITVLFFGVCILFAQTPIAPSGGDGSQSNPYEISSLENLYWIAGNSSNWQFHYLQTNDINASDTYNWFSGLGWTPIGNNTTAFTGSYNGQGYSVDSLYIKREDTDYVGFVGYLDDGIIKNLHLTNINITGQNYVGGTVGALYSSSIIDSCNIEGYVEGIGDGLYSHVGGLIGYSSYSIVKNSNSIVTVRGMAFTGGLVGENFHSIIENSSFIGSVRGYHVHAGGLVGISRYYSTIRNCYSKGIVNGNQGVGGLVGYNSDSKIELSFNLSQVTGNYNIGGLIGSNDYSEIINCYNMGSVIGTSDGSVGGLIGGNCDSEIKNCYSSGEINASGSYVGGLIGRAYSGSMVNCSFWDVQTSGQPSSEGGIGKYSSEMKSEVTFISANWNFSEIWGIIDTINNGYPHLFWQSGLPRILITSLTDVTSHSVIANCKLSYLGDSGIIKHGICWNKNGSPSIFDNKIELGILDSTCNYKFEINDLNPNQKYYLRAFVINEKDTVYSAVFSCMTPPVSTEPLFGDGSTNSPYQISSLENLYWIAEDEDHWKYHYEQIDDINASSTSEWFKDDSGRSAGWIPIGNFTTYFTGSYNGVGYIIDSLFINRDTTLVGFFGATSNAEIKNIKFKNVNITGRGGVGGIVGFSVHNTIIYNCYTSGLINALEVVGGIAGATTAFSGNNTGNGKILNSYSSCSISADHVIGGIVGYNGFSTISNCYSSGSVSGSSEIGGLVGVNDYDGLIENCYSIGQVDGTESFGGLVGQNTAFVNNSFWDISSSNCPISSGGTGKFTNEMKLESTFFDSGWDFIEIWGINDTINYGYPHLYWQSSLPRVKTDTTLNITYNSAEISYKVTYLGNMLLDEYGICWDTLDNPTVEDNRTSKYGLDSIGYFCSQIRNLNPNIQYYACSFIVDEEDTIYGNILSFTTPNKPSITAPIITNIDSTTALANATIIGLGDISFTQHGFCWDQTDNPTIYNNIIELGTIDSAGSFTSDITNLTQNTLYYIRAFAINYADTLYGEVVSFATLETSINDLIPGVFTLSQNYPNPANPTTTLKYGLPEASDVDLMIFDLSGRKIKSWHVSNQQAGWHKLIWDGTNQSGQQVSTGVYIYSLRAGNFVDTKKMIFMK